MTSKSKNESPLTLAASSFEAELARYEALAGEMSGTRVDSEKSLNRARRALGELAASEGAMEERVRALLTAMEGARQRQQASVLAALDGAKRVQQRAAEYVELMERMARLQARAREVNEPVAATMERKAAGASAPELMESLQEVLARMDEVIAEAASLAKTAESGGWQDVARTADGMKQQVQSSRNRVALARQSVAASAPS